jgi:hypothetical protein
MDPITFDVTTDQSQPKLDGSFTHTIETVTRVPRQHRGWQSVTYQRQRFPLFGGIRTNWFINNDHPIRRHDGTS